MTYSRLILFVSTLFVVATLFLTWNTGRKDVVDGWVDHTESVIQQSHALLALFLDAETGERGFLITGSRRYLEPYDYALAQLTTERGRLRRLTTDNPGQQLNLDRLDVAADVKMATLAETIRVYEHLGSEAARRYILSDVGKNSMEQIRSILAGIEGIEGQLLSERIKGRHQNSLYEAVGAGISSAFCFALLLTVHKQQHRHLITAGLSQRNAFELQILHNLVDDAPLGILLLDRRMCTVQVSQRYLDDAGLTGGAILGKSHYETFPNLPQRWAELHRRGLAGETLYGNQEQFLNPDGTEHWVNWRITPWGDGGQSTGGIVIYTDDITQQKQAEAALRTSEAQTRAMFERADQGILTADSEGKIVDANAMVSSLFGYVRAELVGASVETILPGSKAGEASSLLARRKNGSTFPVETRFSYISEREQGLSMIFIWDVTERHELDTILRESETQFRTLANCIPHLCWIANADGYVSWYNQRWYDYTGTASGEPVGWSWKSVLHESVLAEVLYRWTASIASGDPFEMIFPIRAADGEYRTFLNRGQPVKDFNGKVVRWFGTNTDISDQSKNEESLRSRTLELELANADLKRIGEALRISESTARSLFENASQGIITTSREGRIVNANAMAHRLFGYNDSELIGEPIEMLLPEGARARHVGHRAEYLLQPRTRAMGQDMDLTALRKDGSEFPVEICLSSTTDQESGMAMAFVSDITMRRQTIRERELLISGLKAALGEKTVLLQEIHHRVKNNLAVVAAVLGMQAKRLQNGPALIAFEESQQRVLSMARIHEYLYATEHLDRVAFGKYVEQLGHDLAAAYSVQSSKVRIRIAADDIDLPVHQAIPCGLIMNELLSNALKYAFPDGRTGTIAVYFTRLDKDTLSLSCSDDGVGIPESFDWLNSQSLGLRIVRILSKQIDGELVMNRSVEGTSFELKFSGNDARIGS